MENSSLKIATFNIRNITDHYHKRKSLLEKTVKEMNFDIAGFQEVSILEGESRTHKSGFNQLADINKNKEYISYTALAQLNYAKANQIEDDKFNIDGNAIFVKSNLLSSDDSVRHLVLHLSPVRCAQMVSLTLKNGFKVRLIFIRSM